MNEHFFNVSPYVQKYVNVNAALLFSCLETTSILRRYKTAESEFYSLRNDCSKVINN